VVFKSHLFFDGDFMSLVDVSVPGVGEKTMLAVASMYKFYQAAKLALADGWQPGQDLPALYLAASADFLPILGNIAEIKDECKSQDAALKAIALALLVK
jgi:hypothetical protein